MKTHRWHGELDFCIDCRMSAQDAVEIGWTTACPGVSALAEEIVRKAQPKLQRQARDAAIEQRGFNAGVLHERERIKRKMIDAGIPAEMFEDDGR